MDINLLVKLTSRAWSLNILALLHTGVAGRQAPLLAATTASRTAFAASLEHLSQLNLLERNPGHGHPLRPEFRLTPLGVEIAQVAYKMVNAVNDDKEFELVRRSWTVPILAVTLTPKHFSEIKFNLASISDRALSKSLRQLEDREWLQRDVDVAKRPTRPTYNAVNKGIEIGTAIGFTA